MPVTALLGAQWGDEGKGHIADRLAVQSSIVARYNGGDNAGHSITIGDRVVRTHLVPAGAFHPESICVLAAGMVINLRSLAREVDELDGYGAQLTPDRLKIDQAAQLLLPGHIALDYYAPSVQNYREKWRWSSPGKLFILSCNPKAFDGSRRL